VSRTVSAIWVAGTRAERLVGAPATHELRLSSAPCLQ
jgi:hypothetical protein